MKPIKLVLAGQPNVGKSMLINSISNAKLKVGNFAGVTIEKAQVCFERHCNIFELVDLPGTYSINGFSQEEKIAKDYLIAGEYDIIVNVVDSTHIQRNLLLSLELLHLGKKMVIALNMIDEANKEQIIIDIAKMSSLIGVPIVPVSANTKEGIEDLWIAINKLNEETKRETKIFYADIIENELAKLATFLDKNHFRYAHMNNQEVALSLLLNDKKIFKSLHEDPIYIRMQGLLVESIEKICKYYENDDIQEIIQTEHFSLARGIVSQAVHYGKNKETKSTTKKLDSILIHKVFGIPFFLFFMWGLFQLTFTLGAIPMDLIEALFIMIQDGLTAIIPNKILQDVVVNGIVAGVGSVVLFLPNILILYFGIALLETTGYMSRVAFLLDGFFCKFGLHGKSFIPLVTGFGCSVPAYMATRTLKNHKDKLITLFVIGFMSCSARLPVYVLFVGAFFSRESAGNILFLIYITGAIFGLLMAKVLRLFVFRGPDEPFAMEMPKYRLPSLRLIWFTVYNNGWMYLKKAGTFILAASIFIWFASNYPKTQEFPNNASETVMKKISLENSYLGQIGQATAFLFEPLGFDWRMTVALETGLAAKEVVVATLGILYNLGETSEEDSSLQQVLKNSVTLPSAIAFIVFIMLYLPCLAATIVFRQEAGGYRYVTFLFLFTTISAWIMAWIAYHGTFLFFG